MTSGWLYWVTLFRLAVSGPSGTTQFQPDPALTALVIAHPTRRPHPLSASVFCRLLPRQQLLTAGFINNRDFLLRAYFYCNSDHRKTQRDAPGGSVGNPCYIQELHFSESVNPFSHFIFILYTLHIASVLIVGTLFHPPYSRSREPRHK
jgi:hypothetical protein